VVAKGARVAIEEMANAVGEDYLDMVPRAHLDRSVLNSLSTYGQSLDPQPDSQDLAGFGFTYYTAPAACCQWIAVSPGPGRRRCRWPWRDPEARGSSSRPIWVLQLECDYTEAKGEGLLSHTDWMDCAAWESTRVAIDAVRLCWGGIRGLTQSPVPLPPVLEDAPPRSLFVRVTPTCVRVHQASCECECCCAL
jgi:hypothetical protein